MKKILQYSFVLIIGLAIMANGIKSGSTIPPPNAKVYVDKNTNLVYTPLKAQNLSTCIPIKYSDIGKNGFTLYDPTGFNTNGPSLLIVALYKFHIIPKPPLRWNVNNELIEYIE